jgi:hypothetical protein
MAKKNPLVNWDITYKEGDLISVKVHGEGVVRNPIDSGEDMFIILDYVKGGFFYCKFKGFTAWVHQDTIVRHQPISQH